MSQAIQRRPAGPARLYLLGAFRLEVAGRSVTLPTRKTQALLAYLALHPQPAGHSRERLAALLWGDSPDADARRSLRVALAGLRKALASDPFVGDRDTLGLAPDFPLWVDARTFDDLIGCYLAGGDDALAEEALALYCGDLLADFYDDWLSLPRDRLRGRLQDALRRLTDRRRGRGDYAAAAVVARRLLDLDRADEAAHQQLIACYLAQGDRAAARQQYEACVRALREDLGAPPAAETEALLRWIEEAPPARRASAARRGNVPLPLARLIGRQAELAALSAALTAPAPLPGAGGEGARLVTLTGLGGAGKTRLAQELGLALAEHFRDGAWWVDLVPLADPGLIAGAVGQALGLPDADEDALVERLHGRRALLILDNCEHLVDGAAGLAAHLLSRCPDIRILATGREALGAPGEQVYPLAPLPTPAADHDLALAALAETPAVALFVERAAGHQPGFRLTPDNADAIAHICRRLDGIPLAIELAAARVPLLGAAQIAARLDDRFRLLRSHLRTAHPRQQTLQALMDWSYDLLTPDEQALFRRLAVFAGGWTLDAAEAIGAGAPDDREGRAAEVLDLLSRLAAKSLVVVNQTADGARYSFLETILAYARRLAEAGPAEAAAAAAAHLAYFLALAERSEPHLRGPAMFEALARLTHEQDNLRRALAWAAAADADASRRLAGLRLAAALELFWYTRGEGHEGRRWLDAMLSGAPAAAPPQVIARARAAAGTMAWLLGDFDAAAVHHTAALAGCRATGDDRGAAWAMGNLAVCVNEQGDAAQALALYAEAADLAQAAGAAWERALILNNWSAALIDLGRTDDAIPLLEASAAALRQVGDEWVASHPTLNLAEIAIQRGEYDRAGRLLADMAALADRLHMPGLAAAVQSRRGRLHLHQGQPAAAVECYRAALQTYSELADRGEALNALEGLALALADLGGDHQAARLLAVADAARDRVRAARQPAAAAQVEQRRARLRSRLGDAALAAAQVAGQRLTWEDAIEEALR